MLYCVFLLRPELIQDKEGVVVTSVPKSDENGVIELTIKSGTSGDVMLIIRNTGKQLVRLKHITLLWSVNFFDYSDIATISDVRGSILPGIKWIFYAALRPGVNSIKKKNHNYPSQVGPLFLQHSHKFKFHKNLYKFSLQASTLYIIEFIFYTLKFYRRTLQLQKSHLWFFIELSPG